MKQSHSLFVYTGTPKHNNMKGLEGIDWKLLREQKKDFVNVLQNLNALVLMNPDNSIASQKEVESLDGILSMIDSIQDFAVDVMGLPEEDVMLLEDDTADVIEYCANLYAESGASAVYAYAPELSKKDPKKVRILDCDPCDAETPHYNGVCMVCGQ